MNMYIYVWLLGMVNLCGPCQFASLPARPVHLQERVIVVQRYVTGDQRCPATGCPRWVCPRKHEISQGS